MRFARCVAAAAAVACVAGLAVAGPVATVVIDGSSYELASFEADGQFRLVPAVYTFGDTTIETLAGPRDAGATIAYGLAIVDAGGASAFSFEFSMPITLDAGATTIVSSIVGGMTDFTGNGVGISTTGGFDTIQRSWVAGPVTDLGVNVGGSVSFGPGPSGSLYNYGAFATGPIAGPDLSSFATLHVAVDFMASGDNDVIVLTGFTDIVVPAPASMVALAGLGLVSRRRRA
ncbi:MAG: hypothetical protein KF838_09140 [Phycisphaeraceae bacterium]|nr:MAG: hypothetical protein KF838_09140 [Phycisphaeraceae bacterium]